MTDKGGRGSKNPKILRMSYMEAPLLLRYPILHITEDGGGG